jgi:hypothetical protein
MAKVMRMAFRMAAGVKISGTNTFFTQIHDAAASLKELRNRSAYTAGIVPEPAGQTQSFRQGAHGIGGAQKSAKSHSPGMEFPALRIHPW